MVGGSCCLHSSGSPAIELEAGMSLCGDAQCGDQRDALQRAPHGQSGGRRERASILFPLSAWRVCTRPLCASAFYARQEPANSCYGAELRLHLACRAAEQQNF